MTDSFTIRRQVEFSETDMAGIVHFSNYFRWVEAAESALFQSLKEPLIVSGKNHVQGWPRVRASCEYKAPISFQDTVEIELVVKALKIKAIQFGFRIYRIDGEEEKTLAAKGEMTTVCVRKTPPDAPMQAVNIPDNVLKQLKEHEG